MDVPTPLRLFIDLGDLFTKVVARGATRRPRVRFPSVVSRRLLDGGEEMTELLLTEQADVPRLFDFEPSDFPRTRSFAGSEAFVREVRDKPPAAAARFAGRIAAVYGADRRLLGSDPSRCDVDALVRKACMLTCTAAHSSVELTFVVDVGVKADVIAQYADDLPGELTLELHSYRRQAPRRLRVSFHRRHVVDAAECLARAAWEHQDVDDLERILLIDVGYLRTKLAVVSKNGCEHQTQALNLGIADCVHRILRDAQERGLIEDEFAVIRALEASRGSVLRLREGNVDVGDVLRSAERALEEEVFRVARQTVLRHFERTGGMCRIAGVVGGGAARIGRRLGERLLADLDLEGIFTPEEPTFLGAEHAALLSLTTAAENGGA